MTRSPDFRIQRWAPHLCLALLLLGCLGCASTPPTHFFTLTPTALTPSPVAVPCPEVTLGISFLALPDYLDRPQMIIRQDPAHLEIDEFHRWAGSLHSEMLRALADHLQHQLGLSGVALPPLVAGLSPRYRLALNVWTFEGQPGKAVWLTVHWWLFDDQDSRLLAEHTTRLSVPVASVRMADLAAAHAEAVSRLSDVLAAEIRPHCAR